MRLILRYALVAIGFALAAVAQHVLLVHAPARIAVDLAQPLAVATNWRAFGAAIVATIAVACGIGAIGYVSLLREGASLLVTTVVCAVASACAWAIPVLLSSDVYAYAAYGKMAKIGIDPYGRQLLPAHDPLFSAAIWQWSNPLPACVYGPLFVQIAHAIVAIGAPLGVIAQLNGLRILATLSLLACIPLAYAAFSGYDRPRRLFAAAVIGGNPVAIWTAVEGHNDTLMLAIVLAGFALLRRSPLLGSALVALSALVKAPGLAAAYAPLLAATNRTQRIVGAVAGTATVAIAFLPFVGAMRSALGAHGGGIPPAISLFSMSPLLAAFVAIWLLAAGATGVVGGRADGWCLMALGAWVALPNPYPWYAVWFLPVAATAPQSRAAKAIVALSFTTLLRYLPDAAGTLSYGENAALSLLAFAPLLLTVL